jgi:uncharacterized protein involved in exopolysaccharide biosynthesis
VIQDGPSVPGNGVPPDDDEISLFAVSTMLLRSRRRVAVLALAGIVIAVGPVLRQRPLYQASAAFVPQGSDASRSSLVTLAGQFGVALPASAQAQSPDFYTRLLGSRELLAPITRDTFTVAEMGGRRVTFMELFQIPQTSTAERQETAVAVLSGSIETAVMKTTGIIDVTVRTQWPSVSLAITTALLNGIDAYNQRSRQGQAAAERAFVERRLAIAQEDLRAAENRLEQFLRENKVIAGSPTLMFEHDRLQRDVSLKQQVVTALTSSYEDARIREVRDTPVITVLERPQAATRPLSRGRVKRAVIGFLAGAVLGILWTFMRDSMARGRRQGDPDADEFLAELGRVKSEMFGRVRWMRGRVHR